ncbi:uncharacterized protein EAE98_009669 [Botrytis deweyae]|uniref:Uncharacterized protein n=1 Tax=Botrytis deweyae TaxID=2478750 RepID=A0ABQ7IBL6_9HELO|nr:uncharacterized protein EAE98_009669 [Botrytis deweyae]KAF7918891.1 hypothetical protein EAE98_009669 [Botrytis deweyae]KAF7922297.1 hypothetical protein EAE99_007477 [Botrytis elliptica]
MPLFKSESEPVPQTPVIITWQCSCGSFNRAYEGTATRKCKKRDCGKYWVYNDGKWEDDYHGGKRSYYEPWQTDPNVD